MPNCEELLDELMGQTILLYFCSLYNGQGRFSNARSIMLLDANSAENRKKFFMQFEIYLAAKGKDHKADKLKVNMLLHCTGPEAIEEYSHFVFTNEEDKDAIKM